jgi:hypothetical protein
MGRIGIMGGVGGMRGMGIIGDGAGGWVADKKCREAWRKMSLEG